MLQRFMRRCVWHLKCYIPSFFNKSIPRNFVEITRITDAMIFENWFLGMWKIGIYYISSAFQMFKILCLLLYLIHIQISWLLGLAPRALSQTVKATTTCRFERHTHLKHCQCLHCLINCYTHFLKQFWWIYFLLQ